MRVKHYAGISKLIFIIRFFNKMCIDNFMYNGNFIYNFIIILSTINI